MQPWKAMWLETFIVSSSFPDLSAWLITGTKCPQKNGFSAKTKYYTYNGQRVGLREVCHLAFFMDTEEILACYSGKSTIVKMNNSLIQFSCFKGLLIVHAASLSRSLE